MVDFVKPLGQDLPTYLVLTQFSRLLFVAIIFYLILLFRRLVTAVERLADRIEADSGPRHGAQP